MRVPFLFAMNFNFLLATLAAYLLGSIPSGVITSRFFARRDVREIGSGHTGALNTYRAAGLMPALFAFVGDGAKAIVAVQFARTLTANEWAVALAGVAVVIGHCYPLYTRFRGGMGLATGGVVLFMLDALALVLVVLAWFPLKLVLKKSPRASALLALFLPGLIWLVDSNLSIVFFGIGAGAIIFLRHLSDWNR